MSLAGRALSQGKWGMDILNIRDFSENKTRRVDDTPAGGGAGMVLRADVLARAIDAAPCEGPRYLLSPRGRVFCQEDAKLLAQSEGAVFICGRFEGVDERVIEKRKLIEISIGDYVLSGGETAVFVVLDSVIRLLPGVMGNDDSQAEESFTHDLLEYPHYTRPQLFEGLAIPEVLTSGNHREISLWRRAAAEKLTKKRRPDLYKRYKASSKTLD